MQTKKQIIGNNFEENKTDTSTIKGRKYEIFKITTFAINQIFHFCYLIINKFYFINKQGIIIIPININVFSLFFIFYEFHNLAINYFDLIKLSI